MLHLLVDTSVWLDLAKKRDGQKLINVIGQMMQDGDLELLVPGMWWRSSSATESALSSH